MTRKDFKAIAQIINVRIQLANKSVFPELAIKYLTKDLAEYFKITNPKFNRERFLKACMVLK